MQWKSEVGFVPTAQLFNHKAPVELSYIPGINGYVWLEQVYVGLKQTGASLSCFCNGGISQSLLQRYLLI